ncbi:MAG: ABC transporter permease subunit [Chloroflexi bacterium]|nr:MAG: ABC transporter permease subunit [Chloroflexota bacterium]TMF28085.1 MAG: ABC transporter permease subunit [Chloroflexota bacterium]
MFRAARGVLSFAAVIAALGVLWEGIKLLGGDPNGAWTPPFQWTVASDLNMPHVWDIATSFVEPAQRNGPPLGLVLGDAALFTFREAFGGFVFGALLGLALAIVFVHSRLLERALVPYVVASQTVPIIAIAPVVVIWLQGGWLAVAVISAYLTFFPVTIAGLRGLRSPDPRALELMRSYAASPRSVLFKVRLPAAAPYLLAALKVAATASVVGAIIGELPSGIREGLGGAILNFNQYYVSGPPKLWAAIIVAAIVGIGFFVLVRAAEAFLMRGRVPAAET